MALKASFCGSAVNLRRSLSLDSDGQSLLYNAGCNLLIVVLFEGNSSRMVAFTLIMNLKEDCLEGKHLRILKSRDIALPSGGLWMELICAETGHKGANLLFEDLHSVESYYIYFSRSVFCLVWFPNAYSWPTDSRHSQTFRRLQLEGVILLDDSRF